MFFELYLRSPAFLQNIMISFYGAKVFLERFGGNVPVEYKNMKSSFSCPDKSRFKDQEKRLQKILSHCKENVPYYQRILKDVDIKTINTKNLHETFPVLTKKQVLYGAKELASTSKNSPLDIKISTSGTSGTPLTIYATKESRRINYAFFDNFLRSLGSSYRSKSTILAGRKLYKKAGRSHDRYDYFNKTQYLSVYDISQDSITNYVEVLNKWAPEYIDSHPSALFEIQYLAKKSGLKLRFAPKFIVTSSETLTPGMKESIEEFFKAPVYDHYGCAEMCISAFCDGRKYYNDPTYGVIELVEKGHNLYSLVVTGLINFAMPLIRYEIGDVVHCSDSENPYVFESVEGRVDDIIITPEGKLVGRLSPVFKGIPGLELAQVIQRSEADLLVKVVLREDVEEFNEFYMVQKLKSSTSDAMSISVEYVSEIEKQENGKFKTVISLINKF